MLLRKLLRHAMGTWVCRMALNPTFILLSWMISNSTTGTLDGVTSGARRTDAGNTNLQPGVHCFNLISGTFQVYAEYLLSSNTFAKYQAPVG